MRLVCLVCWPLLLLCLDACAGAYRRAPLGDESAAQAHYPGALPEGVVPRMYDVALTIDPEKDGFAGEVAIAVELREAHQRIFLHAEGLHIAQAWAVGPDGEVLRARAVPDATVGLLRLELARPLPPGTSTLRLQYDAPYSEGLLGLYRVRNGQRAYVFSQFEPIAARRAFPCFDEPRFKTPFEVRVTAPRTSAVLSSSVALGEQVLSGPNGPSAMRTVSFAPTPPIPTYLLAFAVGPLEGIEGEIDSTAWRSAPVPLRVFGTAGAADELDLARTYASDALLALEAYTDLAYPYAKLDLLAVPDFAWGAMENVGLLTFRDHLLRMGKKPSYAQRRGALSVIAHELTHQWFGNWVTMPWWNDLWLNEAFATWRGQRTAQALRPGRHYDIDLIEGMAAAMAADRLPSIRRIREPAHNRDDIFNAADVITYQKGAAVLAMLEHWLGNERMAEGVRAHLREHPFGTADGTSFLAALGKGAGEPMVLPVMQSFLDQPGVPQVEMDLRCDGGAPQLLLSQQRFAPLGGEPGPGQWAIPVCVRYGAGAKAYRQCRVLRQSSDSWPLQGPCPNWLVANAEGAGYYRVRAQAAAGRAVAAAAKQKRHSLAETLAYLDNLAAGWWAQEVTAPIALGAYEQALEHPEPLVVRFALGQWTKAHDQYRKATGAGVSPRFVAALKRGERRLARRVQQAAAAVRQRSGHGAAAEAAGDAWGEAEDVWLSVRQTLARKGLDSAERALLAKAGEAYLSRLEAKHRTPLAAATPAAEPDPPQAATAMATAAEAQGAPFFARLVAALGWLDGGEARRQVVAALGLIAQPPLAAQARQLALGDGLHLNETLMLYARQMGEPQVQQAAWAFVVEHLPQLQQRLGARDRASLVGLAGGLCDAEVADRLPQLFAGSMAQAPGGPRVLAQSVEGLRLCAAGQHATQAGTVQFFADAGHAGGRP